MDLLNGAYFSCYICSGKCLYDGLIRAMTLIVFLQIFPYDAYYVYDAYSGVETIGGNFGHSVCRNMLVSIWHSKSFKQES